MGDYLFNQNLLLVLSSITTVLSLLYFNSLYRYNYIRIRHQKKLFWAIGTSIALLAGEIGLLITANSQGNIPAATYYLLFCFDVLLVGTIYFRRAKKWVVIQGMAATFSTALLLLVMVNSFYQYYPTIASIYSNTHSLYSTKNVLISSSNIHKAQVATTIEEQLYPKQTYKGNLYTVQIPGTTSGFKARDAIVYLPATYTSKAAHANFPVIVLLTGVPGSPSDWLHGEHFLQTMDDFAGRHKGITPVVILADHNSNFANDTECVDSSHGNVETYLTVDLPSYIKSNFRVSASPNNWALGGLSEGGMCAAMLTLRHQTVYHHFLDMSGDPLPFLSPSSQTLPILFNGSRKAQREHNIDWLLQNRPVSSGVTGQFLIGGDDSPSLIHNMRKTYSLAVKTGMPVSFKIIPNEGHNAKAWGRGYKLSLPNLSYVLGATNCESDCASYK